MFLFLSICVCVQSTLDKVFLHVVDFIVCQRLGCAIRHANDETQVLGIVIKREIIKVSFTLAQLLAQAHSLEIAAKIEVDHVHVLERIGQHHTLYLRVAIEGTFAQYLEFRAKIHRRKITTSIECTLSYQDHTSHLDAGEQVAIIKSP